MLKTDVFKWWFNECLLNVLICRFLFLFCGVNFIILLVKIVAGTTRTKEMMFIRQPIGVVGMITPWNFPNAMITRKVKKSTSPRPQIFLNLFKLRTFFVESN